MDSTKRNSTLQTILYGIGGLAGINFIIFIHEMGHFLCAKLFNVPTPFFSLGFGPALFEFPIGQTIFKLSLLPFGGYVEIEPETFAHLAYVPKMLILFAGILFNLIFACIILIYYTIKNQSTSTSIIATPSLLSTLKNMSQSISKMIINKNQQNTFVGPIGIIAIIGKILAINPQLFWFILAILSLNIGLFNILPFPFFDGGKAFIVTIETITGKTIPATILWVISSIIFALFMVFITRITINDIKQLVKK